LRERRLIARRIAENLLTLGPAVSGKPRITFGKACPRIFRRHAPL
jgi:hypothetical protein